MKSFPKLLCAIFIVFSFNAIAQVSQDSIKKRYLNILKTNPLALLTSQIPVTGEARLIYERVVSPKQASMLGVSYIYLTPFLALDTALNYNNLRQMGYRFQGYRIQAAHKFYFLGKKLAPKGFYTGPHASFNSVKLYNTNLREYRRWVYTNFSLLFGYQFFIKRLTADICTGIGYRNNFLEYRGENDFQPDIRDFEVDDGIRGTLIDPNNHFKLTFSTNFGFAF